MTIATAAAIATIATIVLDTNVVLDWLLFEDPAVAPLRSALATGRVVAVSRADCTEELRRVLNYPKLKLDRTRQDCLFDRFNALVRSFDGPAIATRLPQCADRDDQKFLELARDAQASCLLSKDKRVLVLGRPRAAPLPFRIQTPIVWAAAWGAGRDAMNSNDPIHQAVATI